MQLIEQINAVQQQAVQLFSGLNPAQLNWKPGPANWSIAQCLHHLMVTNTTYYPIFDKLLNGTYQLSFLQKANPFKKVWGPLLVKMLNPQSVKKLKAPKLFNPSESSLPSDMVEQFSAHQEKLQRYFSRLLLLDINTLVLASPASRFVTYSLNSALQIIVVHEQRHLAQAKTVFQHPNFPKS